MVSTSKHTPTWACGAPLAAADPEGGPSGCTAAAESAPKYMQGRQQEGLTTQKGGSFARPQVECSLWACAQMKTAAESALAGAEEGSGALTRHGSAQSRSAPRQTRSCRRSSPRWKLPSRGAPLWTSQLPRRHRPQQLLILSGGNLHIGSKGDASAGQLQRRSPAADGISAQFNSHQDRGQLGCLAALVQT